MEWFLLIAIVALAVVLWSFSRRPTTTLQAPSIHAPKPLDNIDTTPDAPMSFGYKMSWLALKTEDSAAVCGSLPVTNIQPANWRTGFVAAYGGHVFISPPVNGWTLVVSHQLPELPEEDRTDELTPLLASLSERFGEAQYFGTHRVVDYHAWALFTNGREVRAFAYLGERGEYLANRGDETDGESELGYDYFNPDAPDAESETYWERDDLCYPDEEHVMEVAGKWSVNPQTLEDLGLPNGTGWIGQYNSSQSAA